MNHRTTTSRRTHCHKLSGGVMEDADPPLVIESELRITVNNTHLATVSILPEMTHEFITGYLFTQNLIDSLDDIESMTIHKSTASVQIRQPIDLSPEGRQSGLNGRKTDMRNVSLPRITADLKVKPSVVSTAFDRLFESADTYEETEGVHAAGIFTTQAEPLCIVEDIDRHNCLDKAIGWALLNGVDTSICLFAITSRITSEMTAKICRSGIPFAATRTAVTEQSVAIAKACGMTLAGFVKDTDERDEQAG